MRVSGNTYFLGELVRMIVRPGLIMDSNSLPFRCPISGPSHDTGLYFIRTEEQVRRPSFTTTKGVPFRSKDLVKGTRTTRRLNSGLRVRGEEEMLSRSVTEE